MLIETNIPINRARDPQFAHTDDPSALKALRELVECSEGTVCEVVFTDAAASHLVAILSSPEYLKYILSMEREEENMRASLDKSSSKTHPHDLENMRQAAALAWALAKAFNLPLRVVEHKRRGGGALGLCYIEEGRISIEVRERYSGRWADRPLPQGVVLGTVVHECAHLTGLLDGPAHRMLESAMRHWTKQNLPHLPLDRWARTKKRRDPACLWPG